MTRELNRVTGAVLAAFLIVALGATFWGVVRADGLRAREDNGRNVIAEQSIRRGAIYDQDGNLLANSVETPDGIVRRVYPYPEAASAIGYYSFTYGSAGIEAAFDAELRGDAWRSAWDELVDSALHRAPRGGDILATIDLDTQRAITAEMGDRGGAAVVVEVPSGRVLAMVSQPGYDPNTLEINWERLTEDEATSPLLNRAAAGVYQPGGALQTVILGAILATQPDLSLTGAATLNAAVPGAREPVRADDLTLACLPGAPERPLTLAEAYSYGCPAPFAFALDGTLTPERVWQRFGALGLLDAPALLGFETAIGAPPAPLTSATPPETLRSALVGQGDLTVTPLQMVQIVAAIAIGGNAVPLHLVDATRPPGSDRWQVVDIPSLQPALLRADVAATIQLAMAQAAARSPYVRQAARGDLVLYGHSALAFAGPEKTPYAWFVGFGERADGTAVAVVVVIEDEADPGAAARVAGAAFEALTTENTEDTGEN
jgi:peptidoglycan glycosyltransferase